MKRRVFIATGLALVLTIALSGCCAGLPSIRPTATAVPTRTRVPTAVPTVTTAIAPSAIPSQPPSTTSPAIDDAVTALENRLVSIAESVGPSVVYITSQILSTGTFMQSVPQEGAGSGFVYDDQGHVVTNYHVVEGAERITVKLPSGSVYEATVVGEDPSTDLAVVKIDAPDLPRALPVADSSQLRVGQFAVAIGNPFRQESTMTLGIISALQRVIESPDGRFIGEAIQTDAAINPGNSGGPLLNLSGAVIGVNSQIISEGGGSEGIGFAVSSNTVRRVVPQLIAMGSYPHPWMGVNILSFDAEGAQALREAGMEVPVDEGVLILEITPGSPAERAGLRGGTRSIAVGADVLPIGGDIITAVDGQPVVSGQDLTTFLDANKSVGDDLRVTLFREGSELELTLVLGEFPRS